jgi:hypothetical protein
VSNAITERARHRDGFLIAINDDACTRSCSAMDITQRARSPIKERARQQHSLRIHHAPRLARA